MLEWVRQVNPSCHRPLQGRRILAAEIVIGAVEAGEIGAVVRPEAPATDNTAARVSLCPKVKNSCRHRPKLIQALAMHHSTPNRTWGRSPILKLLQT
jgi:hypothetical protein